MSDKDALLLEDWSAFPGYSVVGRMSSLAATVLSPV